METALRQLDKLRARRRWLLRETKRFENKYGMRSGEFYEKWSKGLLPKPLDPETHSDFTIWSGLVEELQEVDKELQRRLGKRTAGSTEL